MPADLFGGWTCCVEQGHYGHRARKATWLYARANPLPELRWGASETDPLVRLDAGFHSAEERRQQGAAKIFRRLTPRENLLTPPAFAEALLAIARNGKPANAAGVEDALSSERHRARRVEAAK